jgi:fatty acid desaturase
MNAPDSPRRSDYISWTIIGSHFLCVFGAVYAAAVVGPRFIVIALWLWFGLTLNGILNLMHECAHGLAFRERHRSIFLGRWVLAPLVLAGFDDYRERHWMHHKRLGEVDDPKTAYHTNVRGTAFIGLLVRSFALVEAVRKFRQQGPADARVGTLKAAALGRVALVQSIFLASIIAVAWLVHRDVRVTLLSVAVAYGFVFGYGLATLTVVAATLRAVAEHQVGRGGAVQGSASLRNFAAGPIGRLVFGAYGFADHATHHLEPALPYYLLPAATAAIADTRPELAATSGYYRVLIERIRA